MQHRTAPDGKGGTLVGACQRDGCQCAQYVAEGLTTGNRLLPIWGDSGLSALRR